MTDEVSQALLAALHELVDHATRYGAAPLSATKMFDRARAAIAAAEVPPKSMSRNKREPGRDDTGKVAHRRERMREGKSV